MPTTNQIRQLQWIWSFIILGFIIIGWGYRNVNAQLPAISTGTDTTAVRYVWIPFKDDSLYMHQSLAENLEFVQTLTLIEMSNGEFMYLMEAKGVKFNKKIRDQIEEIFRKRRERYGY